MKTLVYLVNISSLYIFIGMFNFRMQWAQLLVFGYLLAYYSAEYEYTTLRTIRAE